MKNLCKHFSGGGNFKHPVTSCAKGTLLSLLLAACTAFTACNNEESLPSAGNQLKLSFGINAPESRAIFTDTKLPDNSPVGVRLDGYADYANLVYTGSTTGSTQSWSSTTSVTLTDTKGTLYAYWPQNNAVSIDAIDVDMTAEDQTDWLYATPVTDVNEDKASVAVTMNHALANINVTVNKGSYLGAGNITNITVQSDGIALGGTFNAAQTTPGYTAFENEGKPLSRDVTTTTGAAATDIMVVPTGTSAAVTFLLTIDGIQFTATSDAVQLTMGNSYQYTLNLSDISTYMEISGFAVKPWNSTTGGTLDLEEYDFETDLLAIYHIDDALIASRSEDDVEINLLSSNANFDLASVERMMVDGIEISPARKHTFTSSGEHIVKYLLKDNTQVPGNMFMGVDNLVEVTLTEGVTTINAGAFRECDNLYSLDIPSTISSVADNVFNFSDNLTKITAHFKTVPNSLSINPFKDVGDGGLLFVPAGSSESYKSWAEVSTNFSGIYSFVILEEGTYILEDNIYYSLDKKTILGSELNLTGEIRIKDKVNKIAEKAFAYRKNITSISIPDAITQIADYTFYGCKGDIKLDLGKNVQSIGRHAFSRAEISDKLTIPVSVENIYYGAFRYCKKINELEFTSGNVFCDNYSFADLSGLRLIKSFDTKMPSISRTNSYAFINNANGVGLYIAEGCESAYSSWISSLTKHNWFLLVENNFSFEDGIYYSVDKKTIFGNDHSVTGNITIKEGVTKIGSGAFAGRDITSITMPSTLLELGSGVFYGCSNLQYITMLATNIPSYGTDLFRGVKKGGVLKVPTGATGYDAWMGNTVFSLGYNNWTIQEMTE